jgi:hypothetical protein
VKKVPTSGGLGEGAKSGPSRIGLWAWLLRFTSNGEFLPTSAAAAVMLASGGVWLESAAHAAQAYKGLFTPVARIIMALFSGRIVS